jgi:rapamycin-insensitive companion of mTOR
MASVNSSTYSVTPTQSRILTDGRSVANEDSAVNDTYLHSAIAKVIKNGRSMSSSSATYGRGGLMVGGSTAQPPGSFTSDLKFTNVSRSATPRPDLSIPRRETLDEDGRSESEKRQALVREKIAKETKIKIGTENMLEALLMKNNKQTKEQRMRVESELNSSIRKLAELQRQLDDEVQRAKTPTTPPRSRLSSLFRGSPLRSPSRLADMADDQQTQVNAETESPTYVLAETLQALEVEGMQPDYYVERANSLVELFKRHPTLKYDLAWSVFGLKMQMMLLSDSREVVAAGYRLTRYAIADRKSIQTIRSLHTDELVVLSLVKDSKASIEREQALKFIRAFLDVKDGVREISRAVIRTLVSVAEYHDDRLRNMCTLTLAEILIRDPSSLIKAGGLGALNDALAEGTFQAPESLTASFLHILDAPGRRKHLKSGRELEAVFAPFTDPLTVFGNEEKLKSSAKAIAAMLKSWPGLVSLSADNASAIKSLLQSLQYPSPQARDLVLELLFDVLRIKPPSWSSTFLAGRRLTTYGRVTNLRTLPAKRNRSDSEHLNDRFDLTTHFTSLVLVILIRAGLVTELSSLMRDEIELSLKRKATLLLAEVLKLANHCLPKSISDELQVLPELVALSSTLDDEQYVTAIIYQIDSINRTLHRSGRPTSLGKPSTNEDTMLSGSATDQSKAKFNSTMDETTFRATIVETNVLNTTKFTLWRWDVIHRIVEGPLTNPKRLDEAIKGSQFLNRLMKFYRPFKQRFSTATNSRLNQRYIRTGCALMKTLLQNPEGARYLADNKLLRQIAECLAQVDRLSGITSNEPLFSRQMMNNGLSTGYFAMVGSLSQDPRGLVMMERLHIFNMFYHIIELKDRDDLIQAIIGNLDFALDSHLRVMLSKVLTTGSKDMRIFATKLLRKYAVGNAPNVDVPTTSVRSADWVIRLLVTQLYDPEVAVCEIAVKILEEACNQKDYLEYVVKCRPALDHLGEIGAPLLLRFLSTSVGYHYLDGLDYITQEMDDWFLGRNDTYVTLVEASLSRAYAEQPQRTSAVNDLADFQNSGLVPPHFYRELTRTAEGCKLLQDSGHFHEFASYIRDYALDEEDPETLLKVKGCLWAVGNVGSMELGAPFLEETEVVQCIVQIAEQSKVISMKGTAFFVLGLISRSIHGLEMLAEYGWDAAISSRGEPSGLCVPNDLRKFFSVGCP